MYKYKINIYYVHEQEETVEVGLCAANNYIEATQKIINYYTGEELDIFSITVEEMVDIMSTEEIMDSISF